MFFSPAFPLLPVNSDNFSEGESEIIKMGLSQISKEEFNNQSLQLRGQLMEKTYIENFNHGWEESQSNETN